MTWKKATEVHDINNFILVAARGPCHWKTPKDKQNTNPHQNKQTNKKQQKKQYMKLSSPKGYAGLRKVIVADH